MNAESLYAVWLLSCAGPCTMKTYKALRAFPSFEAVYHASFDDFDPEQFTQEEIWSFMNKNTGHAETILQECARKQIRVIHYYDQAYPPLLRMIEKPPLVLFVRGRLPDTGTLPVLTVVGARECSENAKKFAFNVAKELSLCGFVIVSGIAKGVDRYAQKGALYAGGPTIAVLPCGADILYSESCRELYERTVQNGALVSEYLPGTSAHRSHFQARNRILSGLSHGLLVVEAAKAGGTMMTASYALEQGKTIFAVPGSPYSLLSEGANDLISDGALVCRSTRDIISAYEPSFYGKIRPLEQVRQEMALSRQTRLAQPEPQKKGAESRRRIYVSLSQKASSQKELSITLGLPQEVVASDLEALSLSDCVEKAEDGSFKAK